MLPGQAATVIAGRLGGPGPPSGRLRLGPGSRSQRVTASLSAAWQADSVRARAADGPGWARPARDGNRALAVTDCRRRRWQWPLGPGAHGTVTVVILPRRASADLSRTQADTTPAAAASHHQVQVHVTVNLKLTSSPSRMIM